MGTPLFNELKKQASYFLKEKLRAARLALTDVTPAELFSKFDGKNWREPYKALILVEHLLTHGPESISEEFQFDREVIQGMRNLRCIDEKGFNWGLQVKNKAERVLKLLEKGPLLKEERARARKISRVIQGFGSFNLSRPSSHATGGSNSHYEDYNTPREENPIRDVGKESSNSDTGIRAQRRKTETTYRAMMEESKSIGATDGLLVTESKLFSSREEGRKVETLREDHPFSSNSDHETIGLLLTSQSW
ncbi:hypothetical protein BHE74_00053800 [Ensete ventricosum]|nr:hypothetical protein GW17_00048552 [Ensete ventricosum]RWW40757.1 hypothetical protein BHE74_00053800 [Ensete ventricosum]